MAIAYEVNVETGEIAERERTEQELLDEAEEQKRMAELQMAKNTEAAAAKAALLAKLGITEDEAKLLLS